MKIVDLFSGCGGLPLGCQNAGFEILAAFDKWEPAVKVYKENFDHPICDTDLGSEEGLEFVKSFKTANDNWRTTLPGFFKCRQT
jgi:DNA (cytosine-5)-methyltransferase 1